ncbi:MAG TPA: type II toxin-antitoxin system RelE/ParE family toxin [Longimicrobium sp.]|nr:type II toxin-antitoxin system RelE/ParE family toxin [Longimicrobium sp.]
MHDEIRIISSTWFKQELLRLPEKQQTRIRRRLGMLAVKGWMASIADGTIDHLRDGIWEMRVAGPGAAYRIFFFPAPRRVMRTLVLATAVPKSAADKQRLLDLEIERAKRRRDEWIAQNRKGDDEG